MSAVRPREVQAARDVPVSVRATPPAGAAPRHEVKGVGNATPVQDVVAVFESLELPDAVLVGQSYGGMDVTHPAAGRRRRVRLAGARQPLATPDDRLERIGAGGEVPGSYRHLTDSEDATDPNVHSASCLGDTLVVASARFLSVASKAVEFLTGVMPDPCLDRVEQGRLSGLRPSL